MADQDQNNGTALGLLPSLLGYHLRRAQIAVFQHFTQSMADADITPGQFGVLTVIEANPGLSQTQLGQALGIDRSSIVGVIDRLEQRGLVIRAPSPLDRRSHALRLSPEGASLTRELVLKVRAHERDIAQALSEEERRLLLDLLKRVGRVP